jgi:hypothetical protein
MNLHKGLIAPEFNGPVSLTPALQRFWAAAEPAERAERLLGTLGGIDVFAVRGDGRSVTIGSRRTRLSSSEGIVLRERS